MSPVVRRHPVTAVFALALAACASCDGCGGARGPAPAARPPHVPRLEDRPPALEAELREALAFLLAREGYTPRTRHLADDGLPLYTNRLLREPSTFLRDHAHQPVDWRAWGAAAFEEAAETRRPVLLVVGAATCEDCRRLAETVWEDERVASFVNGRTVPVLVDALARPDVAEAYQRAAEVLEGRPREPLVLLLTADRRPFFATRDLPLDGVTGRVPAPPPEAAAEGDREGPPGAPAPAAADEGAPDPWLASIEAAALRLEADPAAVAEDAQRAVARLRSIALPTPPRPEPPGPEAVEALTEAIRAEVASTTSGFGPRARGFDVAKLDFLMARAARTGDDASWEAAARLLRAMAHGPVHDHVGGGFFHPEGPEGLEAPTPVKTLADNAQLARVYLDAALLAADRGEPVAPRPRLRTEPAFDAPAGLWSFADVAHEAIGFLERDLLVGGLTFGSSLTGSGRADDGAWVEGLAFEWTSDEVLAALGAGAAARADAVSSLFGLGDAERRLPRWVPGETRLEQALAGGPLDVEAFRQARATMLEARSARPSFELDPVSITAWNALAASALARHVGTRADRELRARVLGANLLARGITPTQDVARGYHSGGQLGYGVLEDNALLIAALLDLYEASGTTKWLMEAIARQDVLDEQFRHAASGAYVSLSPREPDLFDEVRPGVDGALPSANGVTAQNLLRIAEITGDARYRDAAEGILRAFGTQLARARTDHAALAIALDRFHATPIEVVLVWPEGAAWTGGPTERGEAMALQQALLATYAPHTTFHLVVGAPDPERLARVPLLRGKTAVGGAPTAYVCQAGRCRPPTTAPETALAHLAALRAAR